jgi:RNA polymerase sigma factor (sigma-70 family)
MREPDALEVVRRCQRVPSDRNAWDAFYRVYYPYVLVYVRAFRLPYVPLGEQDMVQEIFLKLLEHFPDVEFETERHFRSYLKSVCQNYVLDLVRKYERHTYEEITSELRSSASSPEQVVAESEQREILAQVVAKLPEPCRSLIEEFLSSGKTLAEIAAERNVPLGTVYPRFSRCLAELRRIAFKSGWRSL